MNKYLKYTIGAVITVFVIYNSVYFQSLDEKKAAEEVVELNVEQLVNELWDNSLLSAYDAAINITELISALQNNPEATFEKNGNSLGIGNIGYFQVAGQGEVIEINENNVLVEIEDKIIEIETEFIFGNAIRDASGLFKVNDFDNTDDFNRISESINGKVRAELIQKFRSNVKIADQVMFKGALELNQAHLDLSKIEIIPISLQTNP
ncbi:MAG: DUF2291 family protein [Cyclobacteriaceae bacterium]